mmetsp:Transcript_47244/g.110399  ORF Transcript_47244/g.110399 Transcript_47244/m.110399 type:complete len:308 (-) Transcript_47244:7-930(-)
MTDQGLRILGDVLPVGGVEVEVAQADLGQHLRVGVSEEGRVAAEENVHNHAAAPKIAQLVVVAGQDLGSHVVGCAGFGGQGLAGGELAAQAEVNDLQEVLLDRILGHEQEVLRLQVTVAHMVLVHVVDGTDDLLHQDGRLHLGEVAGLDDAIEELAAGAQLHDQVDVPVVLKRLKELDDVGVVHHLHDGDLLLEALKVLHLRLGDRLHGADGLGGDVGGLGDGSVGALTKLLLVHLVVVRDLARVLNNELSMSDTTFFDLLLGHRRALAGLLDLPLSWLSSASTHGEERADTFAESGRVVTLKAERT